MRRCAVCGRDHAEVRDWLLLDGTRYGMACVGECAGLLWEAQWNRMMKESEQVHALTLWHWRRRRAEVEGTPFLIEPPKSPEENKWARLLALKEVPPEFAEEISLLLAEAKRLKTERR